MTHQMMDCVTSYKYISFSREHSIAEKFGFLFPHNMIYLISLALNNKMKGLMIVHPQLPVEFDGLFLLCQVTANRQVSSKT